MYKSTFLSLCTLLFSFAGIAQGNSKASSKASTLKQVIKLEITGEDGSNGASVAWHPIRKYYYTAMAGNASFPMMVFDAKGKSVFDEAITTDFDVRGLWFNPKAKAIQVNGYGESGWAEYQLLENGKPAEVKVIYEGMLQPDDQSVGAYNAAKNELCFYTEAGGIDLYNVKEQKFIKSIDLYLGRTKKEKDDFSNEDVAEEYNNAAVYTGIKGSEIGLLNVDENQVELYSLATGFLTRKIKLPEDAPVNNMFNFSYANGTWFLFDKDNRSWIGYK